MPIQAVIATAQKEENLAKDSPWSISRCELDKTVDVGSWSLREKVGYTLHEREFVTNQTLLVGGWEDSHTELGLPGWNEPMTLTTALVNIDTLQYEEMPRSNFDLLQSPCTNSCTTLQVKDQSPDKKWQILHTLGAEGDTGTWLVGANHKLRLAPVIPVNDSWVWTDDHKHLLYVAHWSELADSISYISLEDDPQIYEIVPDETVSVLKQRILRSWAFSPIDKQLIVGTWGDTIEPMLLFHYDLSNDNKNGVTELPSIPELGYILWDKVHQEIVWIDKTDTLLTGFYSGNQIQFPEGLVTATFSPDEQRAAYLRGDNLYLMSCH